jgi:hypothetical protein
MSVAGPTRTPRPPPGVAAIGASFAVPVAKLGVANWWSRDVTRRLYAERICCAVTNSWHAIRRLRPVRYLRGCSLEQLPGRPCTTGKRRLFTAHSHTGRRASICPDTEGHHNLSPLFFLNCHKSTKCCRGEDQWRCVHFF